MNQKNFVLWFTGLSGAGKTTIADLVFQKLKQKIFSIERLDGDMVREHLTRDLGFSRGDRDENIRRVGFVSRLLSRNGVVVIASFITPYNHHREMLRETVDNFIEVFVDAPLEVCESRDPKGIYKKARAGEIEFFTGIDDSYDVPESPHIHIKTDEVGIEESVAIVLEYLKKNTYINFK
ncbi:adenylyl-sulfate kinase [Candidatus Falkowbacteria bacterium RIFOXYB2_FULL_34_18]|uniref:Adenylyl-sulfate kinase n=1 Tax=Candidatus Falkowbacteria bacterium RIFOXYD2_FULL_34_120 TaxID=1798007 RepID=A0A1F5TLT1_9BACT|nr:MAG: adenylyl-sulfate kinase [Candidatus Falkowbacteria bacterium RIFOXYB2_FULL_34_18]OGF29739.1 MAG: adenylyl-sulfate kinase [Candidatus Falkowbacteria bacterium RIFOXYC12_FULL_34_55]OGF37903.1 MAG: adenylyl-sulfate kinase [Candidatus Falkowbacteria bacterium RIFOXYC2_FULL_34_220]OGF39633.1 MAG: adenylyl-sulfate kinase [Candidatus Falkowbacteria bacterium RIFOXYD12_FULL_34_57]OGF39893.1 MAG: adenylyl-sulfate kinase [Candidatus Falkowbacteria bacterium RIFOXYD2_FULL_34_120]